MGNGMEHVVYLMIKKGNKGKREPVAVEHLQLEQTVLSRVTLLEPYLEAWQHPSHVCGVIWDKIKESCVKKNAGEEELEGESLRSPGLRELHRYFPDYQVWDRSFYGRLWRNGSPCFSHLETAEEICGALLRLPRHKRIHSLKSVRNKSP